MADVGKAQGIPARRSREVDCMRLEEWEHAGLSPGARNRIECRGVRLQGVRLPGLLRSPCELTVVEPT